MSVGKAAAIGSHLHTVGTDVFNYHPAHVVQFYREDRSLLDGLSLYVGNALTRGDAAIVVATRVHREALVRELKIRSADVAKAMDQGLYLSFEASEIISQITVDGMPNGLRFAKLMGDLIEQAKSAVKREPPGVSIFGEMVALLWAEGKREAAIRLEELWNDLAKRHSFTLRCAYPMTSFSGDGHTEPFLKICAEHSGVIPEESYTVLLGDDERLRSVAALQQKVEAFEKQKALRENEQQLRLLVEAVQDYAIFMLDPEGRIRTWNSGALRIKGYQASEILGQHFSCFYPEEDVRNGKPQRELEIATREGRVEDEGWRVRKDGSKFWANVTITALRDSDGSTVGFAKVTRDVTERMLAQRDLEDSQRKLLGSEKSLRQLSFHLLRTQDEERRRIGRDLHDSLGQYLSVLKMKLDSLVTKAKEARRDDANDLKQCAGLTEDAIKEVRTISYLLYPPMLEEMGLRSAIPWYLDGFMKRSGIKTLFEVSPDFKRLPSDIELALFRVLQESLTNVHRHSGSPTADVRLSINGDAVVLEVKDDGKGVNILNFEESGQDWTGALGVGLRGMTERMNQLGGKLELLSAPGGTVVRATVPIPRAVETQAPSS